MSSPINQYLYDFRRISLQTMKNEWNSYFRPVLSIDHSMTWVFEKKLCSRIEHFMFQNETLHISIPNEAL